MLRKQLENGLDVCIQESTFAKMFALQCWIHVGSIHEEKGEEGMSHCLEHMLFKGTKNFAVGELSRRIEFLGGEMNAYTSFDHTVFYLTLPSLYAKEAVELLAEAIFHSTFDAAELDREKEVILEEMKRGEDSPSHALGRKIFETIYQGTPAASPIIGYDKNIKAFTRDDVVNFHRKWYQPKNTLVMRKTRGIFLTQLLRLLCPMARSSTWSKATMSRRALRSPFLPLP
jgi:zinc protease